MTVTIKIVTNRPDRVELAAKRIANYFNNAKQVSTDSVSMYVDKDNLGSTMDFFFNQDLWSDDFLDVMNNYEYEAVISEAKVDDSEYVKTYFD